MYLDSCASIYTKIATELWKRVMCPASAKAVDVLAVRYVKQGTEAAGFRAGSILYTLVNMLVLVNTRKDLRDNLSMLY